MSGTVGVADAFGGGAGVVWSGAAACVCAFGNDGDEGSSAGGREAVGVSVFGAGGRGVSGTRWAADVSAFEDAGSRVGGAGEVFACGEGVGGGTSGAGAVARVVPFCEGDDTGRFGSEVALGGLAVCDGASGTRGVFGPVAPGRARRERIPK